MAKKIKWHTSPSEDVPLPLKKNPQRVLTWLEPGVLARIVTVEKRGRGWGAKKTLRVLGLVTIVRVHTRNPRGSCEVLRDGKIETVCNIDLRPVDD